MGARSISNVVRLRSMTLHAVYYLIMTGLVSRIRMSPLVARIRRAIDWFYAFDERLASRLESSRAAAIIVLSFGWLCLFAANAVVWITQTETDIRIGSSIGLALATICLFLLARHRLRQQLLKNRMKGGLCIHCGYDLRVSTGRCPECGAVPPRV
jgi:hypothetical protein